MSEFWILCYSNVSAWRREGGRGRKKRRRWQEEEQCSNLGRLSQGQGGAASNHEAWSLGLKLPPRSAETQLSRLRKERSQASPSNLSGCWFESSAMAKEESDLLGDKG